MILFMFVPGFAWTQPGSLDLNFGLGSGANGIVRCVALQSDGKILIGGDYTLFDGVARNRIARLNVDGSLDQGFDPGSGVSGWVDAIALDASGKIIIAGSFATYNGISRWCIARLHANGTLDATFDPGSGPAQVGTITYVESIVVKANGKVLIGGSFVTYNGISRSGLAQLNADGSLDTEFDPGAGFTNLSTGGQVRSIALRSDGYMVTGGSFSYCDNEPRYNVARLSPNAQLDSYFGAGAGADATVEATLVQPDGMSLLAGYFSSFQGVPCGRIARVDLSGDLDAGFSTGTGSNSAITTMTLQPDGKIIVGGYFTAFNSTSRGRLARLDVDGGLDGAFGTGTGANSTIRAMALQPDGRIVVVGEFTSYDGISRNRIARINGGEPLPKVQARAMLGGAYAPGTQQMTDVLRTQALLPTTEPYVAQGYVHVGQGSTSTTAGVLATTGPNAIVDWVILELRASWNPAVRIASRSALLQRDGDIVDTDGVSPVSFDCSPGNFHVAVRHRNHLGVMSAAFLAVSSTATTVDFTAMATGTYGTSAQANINGTMVLWAGDATGNGQLRYTGAANDRDPILLAVGGTTPNNTVTNVYDRRDTNLDGMIKYTGSGNDRDVILTNVGSTTPNNTRTQHLP